MLNLIALSLVALPGAFGWNTLNGLPPRLIGHRGERAFSIPEHSLPSYHMAIWEHADYIEPDLVMTKDQVLVCYHDLSLKSNTDVASHARFASRMRNVTIPDNDGSGQTLEILNDWLIVDFTLAELKSLKLSVNPVGRLNMRLPWFDGLFTIPTFQEYLDLIQDCEHSINQVIDKQLLTEWPTVSKRLGKQIGVIPELKHARWHNQHFFRETRRRYFFEDSFLAQLDRNNFNSSYSEPTLIIQNFEEDSLRYLRAKSRFYLMQLIFGNVHLLTPQGLSRVKEYANVIGPYKEFYTVGVRSVFESRGQPIDSNLNVIGPDLLSREAKKRGLEQIVYTFYSSYEPLGTFCERPGGCPKVQDRRRELELFFELGIDGLFVENIPEALALRQEWGAREGLSLPLPLTRPTKDVVQKS